MENYINWMEYAADAFGIVALACVVLRGSGSSSGFAIKLLAFVAAGLGLISFGASSSLADHSPSSSLTGEVVGFHQAHGYRTEWFEFQVSDGRQTSPVVKAYYFDKDFYYGKPAVSDGAVVTVTYADWTRRISKLAEISGARPGTYVSDRDKPGGSWIICVLGLALIFGGVFAVVRDRVVRVDNAVPDSSSDESSSILKL
jgi:hypothetical protein